MDNHPIKPPSDLVREWSRFSGNEDFFYFEETFQGIADKAAQWGADRQLELAEGFFVEYLRLKLWDLWDNDESLEEFRKSMRPKPLSKKQRAKDALSKIMSSQKGLFDGRPFLTIQEALDTLPDD